MVSLIADVPDGCPTQVRQMSDSDFRMGFRGLRLFLQKP